MSPPPTFSHKTFGCKVNQYDSQLLAEGLAALGLCPSSTGAAPPGGKESGSRHLFIVNTCAVTARAEAKARKHVRRLLRDHPHATVVVTGCAVRSDALHDRSPENWHRLGTGSEGRVLAVPHPSQVPARLAESGLLATETPATSRLPTAVSTFAGHDRAFVKVQDGCRSFCSYCIVPYVRPVPWSKPADEAVDEVAGLSAAGYGEVVLVGVHLGLYGEGSGGEGDLAGLLRRLLRETDVGRLRLSSVEPQEVTDELIETVAGSPRLCPHFHLPLQSGDDRVLTLMNRRYTAHEYLGTLQRIARCVPRPSFTTDVMVGFPGEGEDEFRRTLAVCREAGFSRLHVFRFSPRPGTLAATLPERPAEHQLRLRERRLLRLADELARAYRSRFVGEEVEVLVESRRERATGMLMGLSERYLRVRLPTPTGAGRERVRPGSLVRVVAESADQVGLQGRLGTVATPATSP